MLTGDWSEAVGLAEQYREGWERAGRPRAGNLSRGAYAAATVHGLRGDDHSRATWLEIVECRSSRRDAQLTEQHFAEFFDALPVVLGFARAGCAELMRTAPEELNQRYSGLWRPWYAALWAEAAVLSGPRGRRRPAWDRARDMATDNPIATAIVDRAAALNAAGGDRDRLIVAAADLQGRRLPLPVGQNAHRSWARSDRVHGEDAWRRWGRRLWSGLQYEVERGSVAWRTRLNPASRSTAVSWRSPAWAPRPRPTSCASDPGVQITVERP